MSLGNLPVPGRPTIWGGGGGGEGARSGGAMVLGKLPVPGRPTCLDWSRARAYCSCSRCGWGLCGHFYSHLFFLFFLSLSLGDDPMQTEILSQRVVKPKNNQPTNLQFG